MATAPSRSTRTASVSPALMSPPLPLGIALLEERLHALVGVLGGEGHVERAALEVEARAQGGLEGGVDRTRGPDGWRPASARRSARPRRGPRRAAPRGSRRGSRARAAAPRAASGSARRAPSPSSATCRGAGRALGAAGARDEREVGLGLAELRVVGGDDDVAGHRELAAAAEAEAADGRDQRLREAAHPLPALRAAGR